MKRLGSLAALALLSGLSLRGAESLGQLKPGTDETSVLDGRLTLRLPPGAHIQAMAHGIMSAPAAEAEQTRIVVDAGPQRMVIMTYELFSLAPKGIEKKISEDFTKDQIKVAIRPWVLSSPLKAYAVFPESPTQKEAANLVMSVYVIQSDSTIQELAAYVNPEGAREFSKVSKLAEAICATITEGKRPMHTARGDRVLLALSKEKTTLITVPDGYAVTRQPGSDFEVYHIRKLVEFGKPSMSIGVYFGDHPSRADGFSQKESVSLFGKNVNWYEKITKEVGESSIEDRALVSLGPAALHSFADVFLRAGDVEGMQELKKTAATLRIGESTKR